MRLKETTPSDVDAFIRGTDEARKITVTDEDVKRINDLAREVEIEEDQNDSEPGIARKTWEKLYVFFEFENYFNDLVSRGIKAE